MAFDRKLLLTTTFIAGMAIFAPSLAIAQDADEPDPQLQEAEEQDEEQEPAAGATEVGDIVVTGSRIRRDEYSSASPVEIITAEEATLEGLVDAGEILQSSTAAAVATQINNNFTGFITTGGPGVNTLSLRGLGAQRTLILLNGRRIGPAGVRGTVGPVDLNVIPSSLVDRYELLLDGASSIYGSDALAGVANILTPTTRDGGTMEAFATVPFEEGGEEYLLNGSFGKVFDNGYATIGAEYRERAALHVRDRDYLSCPNDYVFYDAQNQFRADVIDPDTGERKCIGSIHNMVRNLNLYGFPAGVGLGDYEYDPNAVYGGGITGCDIDGWRQVSGGSGACQINTVEERRAGTAIRNYFDDQHLNTTIISPTKNYSLAAFGGYDLAPNVELFGEVLWSRRESSQTADRQIFPAVSPFHRESPFGGACNGMSAGGPATDCLFSQTIVLVNYTGTQQVDYMRGVAGLRGDFNAFDRNWSWDLAAQYSRSDATYTSEQFYNDRVEATAGYEAALAGRDFGVGSADGDNCDEAFLTTATDCPGNGVNWFNPELLATGSAADFDDFLRFTSVGTTEYIQKYVEGVVSGELFTLPAGPVGAAFGFHIRKDEIDDTPDEQEQNGNLWGFTAAGHTFGSDTVKELFAEVELPLLANMPMFDELTLNLSGRFSDYDSYGENSTYKVGLNWQLTPEFRFRASQGTSFRAPALYELFLANQTGFQNQLGNDPCINYQDSTNPNIQQNCAADGVPTGYTGLGSSILVTPGGGQGILEAETGENTTIGFIYTPDFIDFSFAVDYFDTTIENQVDQIGVANILFECYNSPTYPSDPLCTLFRREKDPNNARYLQITDVNNSYVNISNQKQEGLDFNIRYDREFGFGDLTLTGRISHILDHTEQTFADSIPDDFTDQIGSPATVGQFQARFERGDWTVFYDLNYAAASSNTRFFANGESTTYLGEPVFAERDIDDYFLS